MISLKLRGPNYEDDNRMRLFCTLRHFPELRKSLAATSPLDVRKLVITQHAKSPTIQKMNPEWKAVEESRKVNTKLKELRSSVLVEVDNQYADLKGYMREHRERYREERRCHLKLLDNTNHRSASRTSEESIAPTPLQSACDKLSVAGIHIDSAMAPTGRQWEDRLLRQEVRLSGLRQVLSLPPYVVLPDALDPVELSSQPCLTPQRPSWKRPSLEQEFRQHMRRRLEVVLCVRLSDEELLAVFDALYGPLET